MTVCVVVCVNVYGVGVSVRVEEVKGLEVKEEGGGRNDCWNGE